MSMLATFALVAHQGGWDEILLVAGPMVVIAALLVLAKRRVDASVASADSDARSSAARGGRDQPGSA